MKPCRDQAICPKFQAAMEVLAKPWTGLIVAVLADGPLRFGELGERIGSIGDRMLSERLRELEALGVVERHVLDTRPVAVRYELSEPGRAFREVSEALSRWGEKLLAAQGTARKPAGRRRSRTS